MLFGDRGQSLLTLTERRFRVLLAVPQSHQTAASIATALSPRCWRPSRPNSAGR